MTETYDGIVNRMKDKFTSLAGYSPDDASDIGIRLKVLAGEIYSIYAAVDWLKRQAFAQTASGAELEKRALERGVTRKPAVAAAGVLTFGVTKTLWFPAKIPKGTVCASTGTGAVRYVTEQEATLPAGSQTVDVPAKAETPGTAGNALEEVITNMIDPPASIDTVINSSAFTGGEEAESDDSLRARLLDGCLHPSNGTNAAWYRQTALACDGIHSVNVVPRANGAGTVAVYLGGAGAAPTEAEVSCVRNLLSSEKEINVDLTVQAAQTVSVDVTCTVTPKEGKSADGIKTDCRLAVLDYFKNLGVGEPVVVSAMTAMLFGTGLITDCTFSTAGKTVKPNQLAVIGLLDLSVEA
ncbi:MAG: baseplate J/gp47 family protein [Oscillospiraceae bacterium]|jgi:uncharacterized phage protein gp47/JayE|nr:baseplate J/gp47 family protein [Oscillospiraceae bacterium]